MSVVRPSDPSGTRSPRVLFSVTARPALGVIVGHIDHLSHNGWDVHVVVGEPTDARLLPRAIVHVVPMVRGRAWRQDMASYRALRRTIAKVRPDVVVGATPKAAALTMRAARRHGVAHRVWWVWGYRHETSANVVGRAVELDAGRTATDVVPASASLADVLRGQGFDPKLLGAGSIAGIDLDVFEPAPSRGNAPSGGVPTVVFVGRLSKSKGIDHLARMWPRVVAGAPGARLLLAGEPDPLDPADAVLKQLTSTAGVQVLGFVDDVAGLLQQADVLVHPSRREGLPAVVLEAAACAVPAVVWNVTGSCDAVVDGRTGHVVPYGDEHAFADAVLSLARDATGRTNMGDEARRRVARLYTRQRVEEQFGDFLGELVHVRQPTGQLGRGRATPREVVLTDPPAPHDSAVRPVGAPRGPGPVRRG